MFVVIATSRIVSKLQSVEMIAKFGQTAIFFGTGDAGL